MEKVPELVKSIIDNYSNKEITMIIRRIIKRSPDNDIPRKVRKDVGATRGMYMLTNPKIPKINNKNIERYIVIKNGEEKRFKTKNEIAEFSGLTPQRIKTALYKNKIYDDIAIKYL